MPRFARLLATTLIVSLSALDRAAAATTDVAPHYNQIHFRVERSRLVGNDRMQAVLSVTADDDNAARLADEINHTMDWALKTAKTRLGIRMRTGGYRTFPVYDRDKIRRWRATQELVLEGTDFKATELAG